MGLSPGVARLMYVRPGVELNLLKSGQPITVTNGFTIAAEFEVKCIQLSQEGQQSWEVGCEEMPVAWCRLTSEREKIAAGEKHVFELIVLVPDRPENYNRRFVLGVAAARAVGQIKGATGIALRTVARLQFETLSREDVDGSGAGTIAVAPAAITYEDVKPGDEKKYTFSLRNNADVPRVFTVRPLSDFFPPPLEDNDEKRSYRGKMIRKYFQEGVEPLLDATWVQAGGPYALKPDEKKEVEVKIQVPKEAEAGKRYEALVCFDDSVTLLAADVSDWREVCAALVKAGQAEAPSAGKRIWGLLNEQSQGLVLRASDPKALSPSEEAALRKAFNELLERKDFDDAEAFAEVKLGNEGRFLRDQGRERLDLGGYRHLNRLLLEAVFPGKIAECMLHGRSGRMTYVRIRIGIGGVKDE